MAYRDHPEYVTEDSQRCEAVAKAISGGWQIWQRVYKTHASGPINKSPRRTLCNLEITQPRKNETVRLPLAKFADQVAYINCLTIMTHERNNQHV